MKATINFATGWYTLSKAISVAAEMQAGDPDWRYEVVDCKNGFGRIDVYDESGLLVEQGFLA